MLEYIQTDLSNKEIRGYLTNAASFVNYEICQYSLPAEGTFEGKRVNGSDVLVLDVEENTRLLNEFIYSDNLDNVQD